MIGDRLHTVVRHIVAPPMKIRLVFYVSVEPSEVTNQVVVEYVMDIMSVHPGNSLCSTSTGESLCSTIVKCVPGGDLLLYALVFCKVDDCCIVSAVVSYHLDRA